MNDPSDRSGHPGRSALALRFLARSLTLRGASFALSLLAVTTAAAVTATMLNLEADLGAKMSKELRRYGPNLLVTPSGAAAGQTLDEAGVRGLSTAAKLPEGASISPLLLVSGAIAVSENNPVASRAHPATMVGCDFAALREQNPTWNLVGRWPVHDEGDGLSDGRCILGASLAGRIGLTTTGEIGHSSASGVPALSRPAVMLWIADRPFALEVAGIVSTGEAADEQVFVPLPLAQSAAGLPGRVSLAALVVEGGPAKVEAAARAIEAALPGAEARPLRQIAEAQGAILAKLRRMMGLLTGAVLVLSALCLSTTLMSIVIERETEIGLMRSIGASDWNVLAMFVGEVGLLGAAGGLLGLGVAALAGRWIGIGLFGMPIDPRLSVVPVVLGAAIGLCLLSVLLPIRRAMTIQPAAALRGE